MSFDYDGFKDSTEYSLFKQLSVLAHAQKEAEALVAQKEKELEEAVVALRLISQVQLPELMEAIGARNHTTLDGLEITLGEDIRASIPTNASAEAFIWLENQGHGNIIKREFKVLFGKNEEAWAKEFEQIIAESDLDLNVQVKRAVHPSTLSAFVREKLSNGEDLPLDLLGVSRQRQTKIKIKD